MRRIVPVLLVLLGLSACTFTSSAYRCSDGACIYSLSGAQAVTVELGGTDRRMQVRPIGAEAVEVSVRGDDAELAVGESAELDGLRVQLNSLKGEEMQIEVRS